MEEKKGNGKNQEIFKQEFGQRGAGTAGFGNPGTAEGVPDLSQDLIPKIPKLQRGCPWMDEGRMD